MRPGFDPGHSRVLLQEDLKQACNISEECGCPSCWSRPARLPRRESHCYEVHSEAKGVLMGLRNLWLGFALIMAGFASPHSARAEWQAGVYGGYTLTHNSDVDYSGPALGNRTFFDVRWKGEA